jgi:hypothetical protein
MIVHNVRDGRRSYIGSWLAEPLYYDDLCHSDIGRTVIYRYHGRAEAGTITSWRNGLVFARYSRGDTAAGAYADSLVFGIKPLDTPEEILAASRARTLAPSQLQQEE